MLSIALLIAGIFAVSDSKLAVPEAKVSAFNPKGFHVSIPDDGQIDLFAFHGKINEELAGREAGTFSEDVLKPENGRWTYINKKVKLNIGDTLHYWTHVIRKDRKGYFRDEQKFTVSNLITEGTTSTKNPELVVPGTAYCDKYSVTVYNGIRACEKQLIFQNFFDHFPFSYWNPEIKFPQAPDYEFVVYENVSVYWLHKMLNLRPIRTEDVLGKQGVLETLNVTRSCTGKIGTQECFTRPEAGFILPPVVSGQVTTKKTFVFRYGKVEIRAKLPKGDWIYPELYLTPAHNEYGPGYESGQIRIAFAAGNEGYDKILYGGVVLGDSKPARNHGLQSIRHSDSWTDDFHIFTVVWKPDYIAFYVDDDAYSVVRPPPGGFATLGTQLKIPNADKWRHSPIAPFDKEMYLTMGVGVGGFNFADENYPNKPWKNGERLTFRKFHNASGDWSKTWGDCVMQVDYVKIWAI